MKRTRNMYYEVTEESKELVLFAENTGKLFEMKISPIISNLARYYAQGRYDKEKAIDAYYYAATEASLQYEKEFGHRFSVQQRFTAAVEMEEDFLELVQKRAERRR